MSIIAQLVVMASLVEATWETLKMTWQEGKLSKDRVGALVVGLVIAFSINIDLFVAIGLSSVVPYVGIIATGILISRGSNFMHDFIKLVSKEK